jgi:hypothetical protein
VFAVDAAKRVTGRYFGPEVLVLYRKREEARRAHEHGVFARFRYNDLKSPVLGNVAFTDGAMNDNVLYHSPRRLTS